jgi:hypothetical protein
MANKILFMLVECGGYGNMRAELSAFDDTGKSRPFVDRINADLARLPPAMLRADAITLAMTVLNRYGFGSRGSAGLFEDPRPEKRRTISESARRVVGREATASRAGDAQRRPA